MTGNPVRKSQGSSIKKKLLSMLREFDQQWSPEAFNLFASRISTKDPDLKRLAIAELAKADIKRRWKNGDRRNIDQYLHDHPVLGSPESIPADLILAEYDARRAAGASESVETFARRFPQQADELRRLVSVRAPSHLPSNPVSESARDTHSQSGTTASGVVLNLAAPQLPEQFGIYRIVERIGFGGMGAVYLAEDSRLKRKVALKVPHAHLMENEQILTRFQIEARAAAALRHASICTIHDVGCTDGFHYMAMEFIEGEDLSDVIAKGLMPQKRAAKIVQQIAQALHDAHRRDVIHRDLKPSNIRIDERGTPVIMDFGLARVAREGLSSHTKTGQVMGTAIYMAPEQARGEASEMGPCCDIYSLGAVFYELLAGQPPFDGDFVSVLTKLLTEEPRPIRELRPDVDPRLAQICEKAMAKEISERFATMAEFASAIEAALQGQPKQTKIEQTPVRRPTALDAKPASPKQVRKTKIVDQPAAALPATKIQVRPTPETRGNKSAIWISLSIGVAILAVASAVFAVVALTPHTGSISFNISPADSRANASIDGRLYDVSELSRPHEFKVGKHTIKIDGGGYAKIDLPFHVKEGTNEPIAIELKKAKGTVRVVVDGPTSFELSIDDQPVDSSKAHVLFVGQHRLKITADNHQTIEQTINVKESSVTQPLRFSMNRIKVKPVAVEKKGTIPPIDLGRAQNVVVKIDGVTVRNIQVSQELELGEHEITITGNDYETITQKFTVTEGVNPQLRFAPEKKKGSTSIKLTEPVQGVEVLVDGNAIPANKLAQLELEVGAHRLVVKADGYLPYSKSFTVVPDKNPELPVALNRTPQTPITISLAEARQFVPFDDQKRFEGLSPDDLQIEILDPSRLGRSDATIKPAPGDRPYVSIEFTNAPDAQVRVELSKPDDQMGIEISGHWKSGRRKYRLDAGSLKDRSEATAEAKFKNLQKLTEYDQIIRNYDVQIGQLQSRLSGARNEFERTQINGQISSLRTKQATKSRGFVTLRDKTIPGNDRDRQRFEKLYALAQALDGNAAISFRIVSKNDGTELLRAE